MFFLAILHPELGAGGAGEPVRALPSWGVLQLWAPIPGTRLRATTRPESYP